MLRGYIHNERGVSIILLALSIIVLFGFGALAIDVAHIYNVKNELQVAADAAALAGANSLSVTIPNSYDPGTPQNPARQAAFRIALMNTASVAEKDIEAKTIDSGLNCNYPKVKAGNPTPVGLNTAATSGDDDDIEVGHWSGTGFVAINSPGGFVEINAVKVTARRTGAQLYQPRVATWFAKVFKLLPGAPSYDFTSISATAVAAKDKVDIVPIAVNEYWKESGSGPSPPYGASQVFPESFMRGTNINGNSSAMVGKTFAILGTQADSNFPSMNISGYVDILHRNRFHDGRNYSFRNYTSWFSVVQNSSTGSCSPNCGGNLSPVLPGPGNPAGKLRQGDVDSTKFREPGNFTYLFTGLPGNTIPPNAVREYDNNMGRTRFNPTMNGYSTYTNTTNSTIGTKQYNNPQRLSSDPNNNNCPFATIPYYSVSGGGGEMNVSTSLYKDLTFNKKYPKGTRFMVMVYDGTHTGSTTDSADRVTVIGYGIIQVDGYDSRSPTTTSLANLRDDGSTCYGHAVPHGIISSTSVDASDPYLLQPFYTPVSEVPVSTLGNCDFTDQIKTIASQLSYVRLVRFQPSIGRYGVANQ